MIRSKWNRFGTALLCGMIAACVMILLLYIKMYFKLPQIVVFILNMLVLIVSMIFSIKYERKKAAQLMFQEARILSFTTYIVVWCIILVNRYMEDWLQNQSSAGIVFGSCFLVVIGWGVSYLIAMQTYKLKNDE